MTTIQKLDHVAVAGQIGVGDIAGLRASGFRSIICNRPDGEEAGQPAFAEIATAAAKEGIEVRQIPVASPTMTVDAIAEMQRALAELPGPILAYCRSGARSKAIIAAASKPAANI